MTLEEKARLQQELFIDPFVELCGRPFRRVSLRTESLISLLGADKIYTEMWMLKYCLMHDFEYKFMPNTALVDKLMKWFKTIDLKQLADEIDAYLEEELSDVIVFSSNELVADGFKPDVCATSSLVSFFITKTTLTMNEVLDMPLNTLHQLQRAMLRSNMTDDEYFKLVSTPEKDAMTAYLQEANKDVLERIAKLKK